MSDLEWDATERRDGLDRPTVTQEPDLLGSDWPKRVNVNVDVVALVEATDGFLRWWRKGGRADGAREAIEPVLVAAHRIAPSDPTAVAYPHGHTQPTRPSGDDLPPAELGWSEDYRRGWAAAMRQITRPSGHEAHRIAVLEAEVVRLATRPSGDEALLSQMLAEHGTMYPDHEAESQDDCVGCITIRRDRAALATPSSGPDAPVKQHLYEPGGTFEFRESIGQIVYVDRDSQDRRRTTFVAEAHSNAIEQARALVAASSSAPDDFPPEEPETLEKWRAAAKFWMDEYRKVAPEPDVPIERHPDLAKRAALADWERSQS